MEIELIRYQDLYRGRASMLAERALIAAAIAEISLSGDILIVNVKQMDDLKQDLVRIDTDMVTKEIDLTALKSEILNYFNTKDTTSITYLNNDKIEFTEGDFNFIIA